MQNERKHLHFSFEERVQIEKLLKEGRSQIYIAKIVGRPQGSISAEIKRCGGVFNYNAEKATKDALFRKYNKHQRLETYKEKLDANKDELIYLISKGGSIRSLANKYGVPHTSFQRYVNRYIRNKKEEPQDLQETQKVIDSTREGESGLLERIESLEMQIETLFEFIKNIGKQ